MNLTKARTWKACTDCDEGIESGDYHLNLGLSWGRSSRGNICVDCIIKSAETIKNNGGVIEA